MVVGNLSADHHGAVKPAISGHAFTPGNPRVTAADAQHALELRQAQRARIERTIIGIDYDRLRVGRGDLFSSAISARRSVSRPVNARDKRRSPSAVSRR